MCNRGRDLKSPKMFRSHKTTAITTTPFKIDLIDPCIGMNRLTSQSRTPTTIRSITTCIKGMDCLSPRVLRPHAAISYVGAILVVCAVRDTHEGQCDPGSIGRVGKMAIRGYFADTEDLRLERDLARGQLRQCANFTSVNNEAFWRGAYIVKRVASHQCQRPSARRQ